MGLQVDIFAVTESDFSLVLGPVLTRHGQRWRLQPGLALHCLNSPWGHDRASQ